MPARSSDTSRARLCHCERGAASVEYLVVVAIVALSLATTLLMLGPGMLRDWSLSRAILYGSAP